MNAKTNNIIPFPNRTRHVANPKTSEPSPGHDPEQWATEPTIEELLAAGEGFIAAMNEALTPHLVK